MNHSRFQVLLDIPSVPHLYAVMLSVATLSEFCLCAKINSSDNYSSNESSQYGLRVGGLRFTFSCSGWPFNRPLRWCYSVLLAWAIFFFAESGQNLTCSVSVMSHDGRYSVLSSTQSWRGCGSFPPGSDGAWTPVLRESVVHGTLLRSFKGEIWIWQMPFFFTGSCLLIY